MVKLLYNLCITYNNSSMRLQMYRSKEKQKDIHVRTHIHTYRTAGLLITETKNEYITLLRKALLTFFSL